MSEHTDQCTIWANEEDKPYLSTKLLDVNVRLFASSEEYRGLVMKACWHIQWLATTTREGYKRPHGFSGANAGIPWNIIALRDGTIMVNPKITKTNGAHTAVESNCGSLLLPKPIKIIRHKEITVEYLEPTDEGGELWNYRLEPRTKTGFLPTVQHEVDHNNGILITHRRV